MRNRANLLPIVLLIIAVALIAYSAWTAELNIGFWGLIHSYSVSYFVGLGILSLSFITTLRLSSLKRMLLICQTSVFVIALWLLPVMVGSHPGNEMAYRNLVLVNGITEQGLSLLKTHYYLSCPAFHIFFSTLGGWFNINYESLIPIFPFIMQFLYLVPLFIFLRNILGADKEKHCWIGLWIFSLGNWIGQDYFSPQAVGVLLLLAILALITHRSLVEGNKRKKTMMYLSLLLLFGLLAATHLLTSLTVLCMVGAYTLVKRNWKLLRAIGLCVVIVIIWDFTLGFGYIARSFGEEAGILEQYYTETMRQRGLTGHTGALTFDPEYLLRTNITASVSGSESHSAVVKVRIAYVTVFAMVMGLGVLYMLRHRRNRTNIAILAMALSVLVLVPLRYAGWELAQRLYMFELPFVAYFGVMLLETKKKWIPPCLCILFMLLSVPFFISHYGNQASDYWSDNHKDGQRLITELQKSSGRYVGELRYITIEDGEMYYDLQLLRNVPYYMPISTHNDAVWSFIYNKPDYVDGIWEWFKNSSRYESYYRNPEFEIFRNIMLDEK